MKIYRVKVNGKVYEVELEALTENKESIQVTPKEEKVENAPAATTATGGTNVCAPISGKVLDVRVKVGETIKKGQVVAIVEAMKLENEVPSTAAGTVKEIKVSKGSNVTSGEVLIVLG